MTIMTVVVEAAMIALLVAYSIKIAHLAQHKLAIEVKTAAEFIAALSLPSMP